MRPLIIQGPEPRYDGHYWCAVCMMHWKRALLEHYGVNEQWIKENLTGTEQDKPVILAAIPGTKSMPRVDAAVTMAPVVVFGGAPALVCWTHIDAFSDTPDPPAPLPPGIKLITGMN